MSILDRTDKTIDISPQAFRNTRGIFCLNFEKAIGEDEDLGHSGISTRDGSQCTLQLKGCPDPVGGNQRMIHVSLFYDSLVQLNSAGVTLMEENIVST